MKIFYTKILWIFTRNYFWIWIIKAKVFYENNFENDFYNYYEFIHHSKRFSENCWKWFANMSIVMSKRYCFFFYSFCNIWKKFFKMTQKLYTSHMVFIDYRYCNLYRAYARLLIVSSIIAKMHKEKFQSQF